MSDSQSLAYAYNHRSREDLERLVGDMGSLGNLQRAAAIIYAGHAGLTKVPLSIKASLGMYRMRFGKGEGTVKFASFLASTPQLDIVWAGLVDWMLNGVDTNDKMSAGGWNRAELAKFVGYLESIHWRPREATPIMDDAIAPSPPRG